MSAARLVHVDAGSISPYAPALRLLERDITYPLDSSGPPDRRWFRIDHGPDYHPFFSALGEAHWILALRGDRVVGTIAGVLRDVRVGTAVVRALYLCDLKVAQAERGGGLARRMLLHGLSVLVRDRGLRQWRLAYGGAMRGQRGDVMRSARGLHPYRLGRPLGRLLVYFAPPQLLGALDVRGAPPPPGAPGLDLSPDAPAAGWVSTAGRKDLHLGESGEPWPLCHLPAGPQSWRPSLGAYLQRAGAQLQSAGLSGPACFALDERLADQAEWLRGQGVNPGAVCTIHGLSLGVGAGKAPWVHMSTAQI